MAITDKRYPFAWKQTTGTLRLKNVFQHVAGYTETYKKVAATDADAVLGTTDGDTSEVTVTTELTNPDVPRNLTVTTGGTAADIATGTVVVTGTNVEGKIISETFETTANTAETLTGDKAFKTVTKVVISAQDGAGADFTVGVGDKLGLNHRLVPDRTSIVVIDDLDVSDPGWTIQNAPTASNIDQQFVELNTVTPAVGPNGTAFLTIIYWYHKVLVDPLHDDPDFGQTTTSTSSTSTSTSSTSTSTSTSITTTSTSITTTSTSSTSTSTTTLP